MQNSEKHIQLLTLAILANVTGNSVISRPDGQRIPLPTPQRTGSAAQIRTYAETKAREVYDWIKGATHEGEGCRCGDRVMASALAILAAKSTVKEHSEEASDIAPDPVRDYNHNTDDYEEALGLDLDKTYEKADEVIKELLKAGLEGDKTKSQLVEYVEDNFTKRELALLAYDNLNGKAQTLHSIIKIIN